MTSVAEASSASAAATELRGELGAAQQLLKEQQAVVAEAQQLVRSAAAAAVAQQKMRQKLEAELAGKQQRQLEELQAQLEEAAQEVRARGAYCLAALLGGCRRAGTGMGTSPAQVSCCVQRVV